jgi:hypothetical protein
VVNFEPKLKILLLNVCMMYEIIISPNGNYRIQYLQILPTHTLFLGSIKKKRKKVIFFNNFFFFYFKLSLNWVVKLPIKTCKY